MGSATSIQQGDGAAATARGQSAAAGSRHPGPPWPGHGEDLTLNPQSREASGGSGKPHAQGGASQCWHAGPPRPGHAGPPRPGGQLHQSSSRDSWDSPQLSRRRALHGQACHAHAAALRLPVSPWARRGDSGTRREGAATAAELGVAGQAWKWGSGEPGAEPGPPAGSAGLQGHQAPAESILLSRSPPTSEGGDIRSSTLTDAPEWGSLLSPSRGQVSWEVVFPEQMAVDSVRETPVASGVPREAVVGAGWAGVQGPGGWPPR